MSRKMLIRGVLCYEIGTLFHLGRTTGNERIQETKSWLMGYFRIQVQLLFPLSYAFLRLFTLFATLTG